MKHLYQPIRELEAQWRQHARTSRIDFGLREAAAHIERLADQLAEALEEALDRDFNLQEAARRSGYSADRLGCLVRNGTIPNAGRLNAPRIRLRDLPSRPGTNLHEDATSSHLSSSDPAQIARSIVSQN